MEAQTKGMREVIGYRDALLLNKFPVLWMSEWRIEMCWLGRDTSGSLDSFNYITSGNSELLTDHSYTICIRQDVSRKLLCRALFLYLSLYLFPSLSLSFFLSLSFSRSHPPRFLPGLRAFLAYGCHLPGKTGEPCARWAPTSCWRRCRSCSSRLIRSSSLIAPPR